MSFRNALFLAYVTVALLSLTGALFRGAATADGLYLGLPAGLAWVTAWAVATFLVLVVYDATRPAGEDDAG